jgi:hypothetical protein
MSTSKPDKAITFYQSGTPITKLSNQDIVIAGDVKTAQVTIKNNYSQNAIELVPWTKDPNLTIEQYPKSLGPNQTGSVVIRYAISNDAKEPPQAEFGFNVIVLTKQEI